MNKYIYCLIILLMAGSIQAQNIIIEKMDINSYYDDFSSALTKRGNEMYITSDKDGNQNIYKVVKENNTWVIEDMVSSEVNSGTQNGAATLTPDGQYMVFSAYKHDVAGQGRTDLYSARKIRGDWGDVQNLGPNINSLQWDSQPSLSSDGNTLYFVSDRKSDNEGTNIFYSKRTREGWSKAKELNGVNTDSDEMSPIIADDNSTFTFSSNRSGGQGGFDIYFASISQERVNNIENAGSIINTQYDEYFYTIESNSNRAYYSSNKAGNNLQFDIYSVVPNPIESDQVVTVHGTVNDAVTQDPLGAKITITDIVTGQKVAELRSDDVTGEYNVVLTSGRNYSITAEKNDYLFYSGNFNIPDKIIQNNVYKDIQLSPLKEGKTTLLVFFDFDRSSLKPESKPELDRLADLLRDRPNMRIELHGHTDRKGTEEYNVQLSKERAESVKQFLVDEGIDSDRVVTKGFGKSKPISNETNEEAQAKNRRVELHISNI